MPPLCALGASDTTTLYPLDSRVYIPAVTIVSWNITRSTFACNTPHKADSNPPFRLFWMLYASKRIVLTATCQNPRPFPVDPSVLQQKPNERKDFRPPPCLPLQYRCTHPSVPTWPALPLTNFYLLPSHCPTCLSSPICPNPTTLMSRTPQRP